MDSWEERAEPQQVGVRAQRLSSLACHGHTPEFVAAGPCGGPILGCPCRACRAQPPTSQPNLLPCLRRPPSRRLPSTLRLPRSRLTPARAALRPALPPPSQRRQRRPARPRHRRSPSRCSRLRRRRRQPRPQQRSRRSSSRPQQHPLPRIQPPRWQRRRTRVSGHRDSRAGLASVRAALEVASRRSMHVHVCTRRAALDGQARLLPQQACTAGLACPARGPSGLPAAAPASRPHLPGRGGRQGCEAREPGWGG